jgi:uncharacterized protein (UPF0332 family)
MDIKESIVNLSKYRLRRASESLDASKLLLNAGHYSESINRSYYSIFNSLRALLAYEEFDSKKHSGIISYFNQYFVKNGEFTKEYSVVLSQAFMIRNRSDYDDFYVASKEEAVAQLENAEWFKNGVENYLGAEGQSP